MVKEKTGAKQNAKPNAKNAPEAVPQGLSRGEREAAKRARKLRRQTSADEQKLWHQLRDKQLDGFRFKRQRSIGKYIVDFVSEERKLIVELRDRLPDSNPMEKARAAYFKAQGYLVLQMLNNEVSASIKTGLEAIRRHLRGDEAVEKTAKPRKVTKAKQSVAAPELAAEGIADTDAPAKKVAAKKSAAKKAVAKKAIMNVADVAADESADEPVAEKITVVKKAAAKKPAANKPVAKKKSEGAEAKRGKKESP